MRRKIEFQRRHFEFLASLIGDVLGKEMPTFDTIHMIARGLSSTNINFNTMKFIDACTKAYAKSR